MLVQAAPQRSEPLGQGATHIPAAQIRSPAQALPQRPQWLLSPWVLVHVEPHRRLGGAQPPSTIARGRQVPAAHTCPVGQARPQPPQCSRSELGSTQRPSQSVWPIWQIVAQAPASHTCPVGQRAPQRPQWSLLVWVSTQASLHTVWPAAQPVAQTPARHTWPIGHAALQTPQLSRSVMRSTQRPLHWVEPGAQSPRRHRPAVHA